MKDDRKNYMNVFEHYDRKGKVPHENDITRGLARILNDNIYIFKLFIEKIQKKLNDKKSDINLGAIENKYDVNIQTRIKNIETEGIEIEKYKYIVGVALTAKECETELKDTAKNEDRITDIIIENFNETLIVIEAKKTDENCEEQLSEQINSIRIEPEMDKFEEDNREIVSIEWEDIIEILENYKSISEIKDVIVDDYYEYLNLYFKEWFKVKKIGLCDSDKELDKRLKRLLQDIQTIDEKSKEKLDIREIKRNNLYVNWNWTNHIPFKMNYDNNEFIIEFYPASSSDQYNDLKKVSNLKFITENLKYNDLIINDEKIKVDIIKKVFIRIGGPRFKKTFDNIYIEVKKEKEYYELINKSVSGQWNYNEKTENYEKKIPINNQNNNDFYEILSIWDKGKRSREEIKTQLVEKIVTNQNEQCKQLNVCLGFSMEFKIKIDDLKKYDEDFDYRKECNDGLANPIRDFILEIKKYIES